MMNLALSGFLGSCKATKALACEDPTSNERIFSSYRDCMVAYGCVSAIDINYEDPVEEEEEVEETATVVINLALAGFLGSCKATKALACEDPTSNERIFSSYRDCMVAYGCVSAIEINYEDPVVEEEEALVLTTSTFDGCNHS